MWRCATRIEKGREACPYSTTLNEGWVQKILAKMVCESCVYNEDIVRDKVDRVHVHYDNLEVICKDGSKFRADFHKVM